MRQEQHAFDCIVVGAGPVGMTLAALLSEAGASVLVLERNSGTSESPKAISIDDESLRTYAAAGLVERLLSIIVPGTGTRYYDAGGSPVFHARAEFPYRLGYPFKNPFAQPDLERVLLAELTRRSNVELRFAAELVTIDAGPDGVLATYRSGGVAASVEGRFLIGADGGRSTVRTQLGIGMRGRSHPERWLVIDVLDDPHRERYGMHHGDPARPHVIVPGLEGRCRYEFLLFEGEGDAGDEPRFELIRALLQRYRAIEPHQVERAVIYKFHGLIAREWSVGRAFLVGDAAHMMPPFAGQGLNSGIRDAANLAWKLVAVLRGESPERILMTYQQERFEHAWDTITLSEKLGRVVMTTSPRIAAVRDRTITAALESAAGRDYFEHMKYRPESRVHTGLIVAGAHPAVGRQLGQPRAFNAHTRTVGLLDAFLGRGWALVAVDIDAAASAGSANDDPWPAELVEFTRIAGIPRFEVPIAEVFPFRRASETTPPGSTSEPDTAASTSLIDVDTKLIAEFVGFRNRYVLLRPDHVVAAVWAPEETAAVLTHVRSWWTAFDTQ